MRYALLYTVLLAIGSIQAQVGISTSMISPDPSAMLEVKSTEKGLLVPRMTMAERNVISNPAHSLLIYQTDQNGGYYYNAGSPTVPNWQPISASGYKIPIVSLPVIIAQSGSYVLTKNLVASAGITVNASNVSIDLNGFTLEGAMGNAAPGILISTGQRQVTVYNGFIANWGEEGILADEASNLNFYQLGVSDNGYDGINAGNSTTISRCNLTNNGFTGLTVGDASNVMECNMYNNTGGGLLTGFSATVSNINSSENGGTGLTLGRGSSASNCSAYLNANFGFNVGAGSNVSNCSAFQNNLHGFQVSNGTLLTQNTSRENGGHGYYLLSNVSILDNVADLNTGSGFESPFNNGRLEGNTATSNVTGFNITGSGWAVLSNRARSNIGSNFAISSGNSAAPIVTMASLGAATHPLINISY